MREGRLGSVAASSRHSITADGERPPISGDHRCSTLLRAKFRPRGPERFLLESQPESAGSDLIPYRIVAVDQAREKDFQGHTMNRTTSWMTALALLGFSLQIMHSSALAQQPSQASPPVQRVAAAGSAQPGPPAQLQASAPLAPAWIPLNPKHQEYVDQVLTYWEFKSSKINRYRCAFRRWEYDPVFGPQDTFKTYSEGSIKYSQPDKGLFRVEKMVQYEAPSQAGGKPGYKPAGEEMFEHWVCDGEWVFNFDHQRKRLVQTQLPPDMRGKAIGNGPLPFLFNAKADDIKRRFWLRVITPTGVQNEYHLEAVPRTQEDAANFKMIHVIIDESDYLPKAMVVFDRNYSPQRTPSRTTFEFLDRDVNFSVLAEQLNLFHREFFEPAVPSGWAKDVRKWNQSIAAGEPPATTATREHADTPPTR